MAANVSLGCVAHHHCLNRYDFNLCLKTVRLKEGFIKSSGRLFQRAGPEVAKLRGPIRYGGSRYSAESTPKIVWTGRRCAELDNIIYSRENTDGGFRWIAISHISSIIRRSARECVGFSVVPTVHSRCIQITERHGLNSHSYADDIQLYCLGKTATGKVMNSRMVACVEEISRWMTGNRLKLNTDKTQFIWHGSRVQLTKVNINSIVLDGFNIPVSAEVRCLGVVLDGELTFASHTQQLSRNCFYQLRQLRSVRRLLTRDATKTLVHASILSRIDYCNSVLNRACAVHL